MGSTKIVSEEKLHQFLRDNYATGNTFTHTSISSPPGRYYIPDDKLDKFEELYCDAVFNHGANMHLTEAPSQYSPIKIDLDFRYMSSKEERRYTIQQIIDTVDLYMTEFREWFYELDANHKMVLIFEKDKPRFKDSKDEHQKERIVKDGVHIMWPWLVSHWTLQEIVRKSICSKIGSIFESIQLTNSIYEVIDKQVIIKNPWQMYGSRKPGCSAYKLSTVLYCADDGIQTIDTETFLNENGGERWLLTQLRIKRSATQSPPIVTGKQEQFEEEGKILEVQVQVKQNIKKKFELTENVSASDKDIEMAKDLVSILDPSRASEYKTWIEVGWCLHNIHNEDDTLLKTWIEFSKKDPRYVDSAEEECSKFWNHAHDGGLAMGTLCHWAKTDNAKAYFDVQGKHASSQIQQGLDEFTEHEIAVVMKHLFKNEYVCTNYKHKTWFYFDGTRWQQTDSGIHLRRRISTDVHRVFEDSILRRTQTALISGTQNGEELDSILQDQADLSKANKKKIKKLRGSTSFKNNVMVECSEIFYTKASDFLEQLDMNLDLLGFENGVYELDTGIFRAGRPEDYITMSTKIDYKEYSMENEQVKEIQEFFSKIYTLESVREYMLTLLSTFLSGSVKEEKFHIWTGTGSNGKSKMLELFQYTIGDYYGTLPISLLTGKRADCISANPHMSRTKGKRFVVLNEPDTRTTLNVGLMKELTGGDIITTRPLYQDPFDFKPQFKIALVANDIPAINPDDEATWRRVRVAQHKSKFVPNPDPKNPLEFKRDNNLSANKLKEWSQPFMWLLLQYYKKYLIEGRIIEPPEVTKYTEEYQMIQDHIAQFIQERIECTQNEFDVIRLNETYDEYKLWIKDAYSKVSPKNRNQFRDLLDKKLNTKCFDPRRLNQNNRKAGYAALGWYGYKLITKYDEEFMPSDMASSPTQQTSASNQ